MKSKKAAIIYHYLAHYRQPVFLHLCSILNPEFTLISDKYSLNDIKTIDINLSTLPSYNGGLRWLFVKNIWFLKDKFLWQIGILNYSISNQFDSYIFLGNPYFISTWLATIILRLRKKRVYFWTHGVISHEKGIKNIIRTNFYKLSNGLFLYGNYAKSILIEKGFSTEKLHVIYNSLDYCGQIKYRESLSTLELYDYRRKLFINPELPQLIFIGRLTKQKKLFQIIEAMDILSRNGILTNLLFVGSGEEKDNLLLLVNEKGLASNVNFYGSSYNEEENYKLIASSDICISPGEVGLTAIHSLTYGTPVITHNNFNEQMPEFEAIKSGFSGTFFEQNNIMDLAKQIEKWLITNKNNSEIKKFCYNIIDTYYNPKYQVDTILKVIDE